MMMMMMTMMTFFVIRKTHNVGVCAAVVSALGRSEHALSDVIWFSSGTCHQRWLARILATARNLRH